MEPVTGTKKILPVLIHIVVVLEIITGGNKIEPSLVCKVPFNRFLKTFSKNYLWFPSKFLL